MIEKEKMYLIPLMKIRLQIIKPSSEQPDVIDFINEELLMLILLYDINKFIEIFTSYAKGRVNRCLLNTLMVVTKLVILTLS